MPPEAMNATLYLIVPVLLDLALGDPGGWPHPVKTVGETLDILDRLADRRGWRARWFGAAAVIGLAFSVFWFVVALGRVPGAGIVISVYLAYAGLALGGLWRETRKAARLLAKGDLAEARLAVGRLVSRDTSVMDEGALRRALAETLSENLNDAFVAPLCYLALGGPPLLWAYKVVSTADSMWGYRTPRYERLGWFGARADDVMAWLPARLTAWCLFLAGKLMGLGPSASMNRIAADAGRTKSPNAGWPMAAAAWMLGAPMGGPGVYFGVVVDKPRLGPETGEWDDARLVSLGRLVLAAGLGLAGCFAAVGLAFGQWWR